MLATMFAAEVTNPEYRRPRPPIWRRLALVVLCGTVLLASCGSPDDNSAPSGVDAGDSPTSEPGESPPDDAMVAPTAAETTTPEVTATAIECKVKTVVDWQVVESLEELVSESTLIIVGKVIAPAEIVNLHRDVNDISKPDPTSFGVGQVYDVEVQNVLKGEAGSEMRVVQSEGKFSSRGAPMAQSYSDDEIAHKKQCALQDGLYVPMTLDASYVFFLDELGGFDPTLGYFTGSAGVPWRLVYKEDGTLIPESPVDVANERIGQITFDELTALIQGGG